MDNTHLFAMFTAAAFTIFNVDVVSAACGQSDSIGHDHLWSRTHRVFASDAPRWARYPSMARTDEGDVVVLFTHVTKAQKSAGNGDLMMIRSGDRGQTWSAPVKVYEGKVGEPRTMGSLTRLASDRLAALVAEARQQVRMLTSDDGGQSWQTGEPLKFAAIKWASPYGRLIEMDSGTLAMAVEAEVEGQAKPCTGLLRSTDGGMTWGDFSLIARGFKEPTVIYTGNNSLIALINAGEVLYRCVSEDDGYHWTAPDQIRIGREAQLIRIEDKSLVLLSTRGDKWRWIRASFSYDNGMSWRCDRKVMEHPGEPGGHAGWATGLALDADHLMVVLGHTQLPSASMDAPGSRPIAEEEERIEAVFFKRDRQALTPERPRAKDITPPNQRDRWVRADGKQLHMPLPVHITREGELISITGQRPIIWLSKAPNHKAVWGPGAADKILRSFDGGVTWQHHSFKLPPDFRGEPSQIIRLKSGRILCVAIEWLLSEWKSGSKKIVDQRGGYYIWDPDTEAYDYNNFFIIYSDDDGKTWQGTDRKVDFSPLHWALPNRYFVEREDGTIVLPIWGCLSEQDGRERLDAGGLIRSTDGGETWGDYSQIVHDKEHRWTAYNEAALVAITDDHWVIFMRTEYRGVGNESGWTSRAITTDGGYTWSEPELSTMGAAFGAQLLPDGGIVVGHQGGIRFTYDLGRTWTRLAPAGGYAVPILIDKNTLLVGNEQNWGHFSVYRREPK